MNGLRWSVVALGLVGLFLGTPGAWAQNERCCQLAGWCHDLTVDEGGDPEATCVSEGGQPTDGPCNENNGLCGGTTVCCACDEPKCLNLTAAECEQSHFGEPVQHAICNPDEGCVAVCPAPEPQPEPEPKPDLRIQLPGGSVINLIGPRVEGETCFGSAQCDTGCCCRRRGFQPFNVFWPDYGSSYDTRVCEERQACEAPNFNDDLNECDP